jgi:hypothetical protein
MSSSAAPERLFMMTDEPPTTFHRFLDLPEELQLMVTETIVASFPTHKRLFLDTGHIDEEEHTQMLRNHLLPLLKVQKHFASLISKFYYGTNTFVLDHTTTELTYRGQSVNRLVLWRPQKKIAERIKHLSIHMQNRDIHNTREDMLLTSECGWRWLLKPTRALDPAAWTIPSFYSLYPDVPDADQDTAWQNDFTKLETLEIVFIAGNFVDIVTYPCCFDDARWAQIEGWLAETEILLRARKRAQIVLRGWKGRRGRGWCEEHERRCTRLEAMVKS